MACVFGQSPAIFATDRAEQRADIVTHAASQVGAPETVADAQKEVVEFTLPGRVGKVVDHAERLPSSPLRQFPVPLVEGLKPMIEGHQTRHDPHRGRYFKPQRLHAAKAYGRADLRKWLRGKRIARKGIESSERLGRRRWVIERTMSWLSGYRRLSPRYERNCRNYLGFLGLAAAMCCYKRLVRLTT